MSNKEETKKYTEEEIYQAMTKECVESNKLFRINKKLTNSDYEALGKLNAAFHRLKNTDTHNYERA